LVLGVTIMMVVITPSMTEVYASDEGDIVFRVSTVSQYDKFLMM